MKYLYYFIWAFIYSPCAFSLGNKYLAHFTEDCVSHSENFSIDPIAHFQQVRNCISIVVDKGIKPLCDQERDLQKRLEIFEYNEDHDQAADTTKQIWAAVKGKYAIINAIDPIIYEADMQASEFKKLTFSGVLSVAPAELVMATEVDAFTQFLNDRVKSVCNEIEI